MQSESYMILFLVALHSPEHKVVPQCALDAFTCAERFSGCKVVALTDMDVPAGWESVVPYNKSMIEFTKRLKQVSVRPPDRYFPMCKRYFVMQDYVTTHKVSEPIFNCDWDLLILGNLPEYFHKVGGLQTDLCSAVVRCNGYYQEPMLINRLDALQAFVDQLWHLLKVTPNGEIWFCDMTLWTVLRNAKAFTDSFTCSQLGFDCYFDYNMSLDNDIFEHENGSKKMYWMDGKPHFKVLTDGSLVRAIALHTFIGWRNRTQEIMKHLR